MPMQYKTTSDRRTNKVKALWSTSNSLLYLQSPELLTQRHSNLQCTAELNFLQTSWWRKKNPNNLGIYVNKRRFPHNNVFFSTGCVCGISNLAKYVFEAIFFTIRSFHCVAFLITLQPAHRPIIFVVIFWLSYTWFSK